jgi:hypothetical protein
MTGDDVDLVEKTRAFVIAAWRVLRELHVVPPPPFHPYLSVGRDYAGMDLMELPEFAALEAAIQGTFSRFAEEVPFGERDYANGYIFSFLDALVASVTLDGVAFWPRGPQFGRAVDDLLASLRAESFEVACCRVVSHLTTDDRQPLEIRDVTVVPLNVDAAQHNRSLNRIIEDVIPRAASAYGRIDPHVYAPPESVLIARGSDAKPFDIVNEVSQRIETLLLLVRLLHAGTSESVYEVQGETSRVRRFSPTMVRFRGAGPGLLASPLMIRRTVRLTAADGPRVEGLWKLIASAERDRPGMILTSFAMAMHKFQLSYHAHTWYESLVDLATAFEAALSGKDKTDVVLRLRTRAAALLASENDPASAIFNDVGELYGLRSTLVHGGEMKEKDLLKAIKRISTVPDNALFGVALGHAVDRLRDLVRRSLLVRVWLGSGDEPLWPLGDDVSIDAKLADDEIKQAWRTGWRETLASFDAQQAAERPAVAADFLSQEDR